MLTKFASFEDAEILENKGSSERIVGAGLDKLASYSDYRTDDGYLYTRVRAISSRVNKNHDGWPSEELAKSYLTFIGKPIFVDHNNSDPSKARGVIVDAKLHIEEDPAKVAALDPYYANAPDNHKPPTWIELLLEVDAKQYPKLAAAIINDDIDGVSMGANVERSKCSHCHNWATTPEEYCTHVMQKGASFDRFDDFGRKTSSPAYEDCYDIGFFEISYVFDPADETALDLGDKRHASVEAGGKKKIKPSQKNQMNKDRARAQDESARQQAFNEQARKVRERSREFAQRDWEENSPFFATPDEDYQVPAPAPEGGALGSPKPPTDGGWDVEKKNWVDPSKTPSTVAPDLKAVVTVPCPTCMGGVNRANCPTCGGKGQIPAEKGPLQVPEQVQPSPYRQNAEEQAAAVPDDARALRMKQKNRLKPNRFQGGFFEKSANGMDMGGFGGGAPDNGGSTPPLPGAQEGQNCPTCGGAMQNGVCPTCTQQPAGDTGAGGAGAGDTAGMGMQGSFKVAADGHVVYSDFDDEPMPPHAVNSEFDEADNLQNATIADLIGQMSGMTPAETADRAVGMSQTPEQAVERLVQWGVRPAVAEAEIQAAIDRKVPEMAEHDEMPDDPFIDKQGNVKYADQAPLPQSMMTTAPEDVNTLRQETVCEVCGSDMEDGKCAVCGYEQPPEGFDNPDLEKAQQVAEMSAQDAGPGGGEPPPGVMAPPGGAGGGGGAPGPGAGGPPPGAGGGAPMSSTRKSSETPAVTSERTAGKIRNNEQPILPATKTVSDHPKTTQVVKEPTRLTQSKTNAMTQIPTTAQVAAEMVKRGTFGVKTAAEAEALLVEKGLDSFLAANPASDPAEHHQEVEQVGGEVDNPLGDIQHIDVEKQVDIEKIPTKTWSGEADQHAPVTPGAGNLGGPIGDTLASTKEADTQQSGIFGDEIAAEKQIDVEKPLQPEFTKGPETQTFKSDPFHVGDPVTTENSNQVGGPIGTPLAAYRTQIVAHFFSALKVAEQMVTQGLVPEDAKFELAAQLEQESAEQLQVRTDMLAKTKTAGFRGPQRTAAAPKLAKMVNSSHDAGVSHEIEDTNLGDSALFGR